MSKLLSGRFILTVTCGIVFAVCAMRQILPVETIVPVLTMVFISYFQRPDRNNGEQTVPK